MVRSRNGGGMVQGAAWSRRPLADHQRRRGLTALGKGTGVSRSVRERNFAPSSSSRRVLRRPRGTIDAAWFREPISLSHCLRERDFEWRDLNRALAQRCWLSRDRATVEAVVSHVIPSHCRDVVGVRCDLARLNSNPISCPTRRVVRTMASHC